MLLYGTQCFLSLLHSDLLNPAIVAVVDPTARYSAHAACAGHSEACLDDDKRNIKTEKKSFQLEKKEEEQCSINNCCCGVDICILK